MLTEFRAAAVCFQRTWSIDCDDTPPFSTLIEIACNVTSYAASLVLDLLNNELGSFDNDR
jgi:hypothetical protein